MGEQILLDVFFKGIVSNTQLVQLFFSYYLIVHFSKPCHLGLYISYCWYLFADCHTCKGCSCFLPCLSLIIPVIIEHPTIIVVIIKNHLLHCGNWIPVGLLLIVALGSRNHC